MQRFAVTLQPRDKTLTDQEIDAVTAKVVAEVAKRTGGSLRGLDGEPFAYGKAGQGFLNGWFVARGA